MPIPTDTLRNSFRLNIVFAVSCALLALTTFWLIWVDYNRPWKEHQNDYMDAQAALAELQYLTTQQESFQKEIEAAKSDLDAKARKIDPQENPQYADLLKHLQDDEAKRYALDMDFKSKDALIVVSRNKLEKVVAIVGPDASEAKDLREKVRTEEEALALSTKYSRSIFDLHSRNLAIPIPSQDLRFLTEGSSRNAGRLRSCRPNREHRRNLPSAAL